MKSKIYILFFGSLFIMSCNSEFTSDETKIVEEHQTANETSEFFEDTIVTEPTFEYKLLEDYALLNTKTKLYEAFDASALKDDTTWIAEGTEQVAFSTLVNPTTNHTIRFYWEENGEDLYLVEADYYLYNSSFEILDSQRVSSEYGLYTGMPLEEVITLNDTSFSFAGFDWDYGGGVMFDNGGALAESGVSIRLNYLYNSGIAVDDKLIGDQLISTSSEEAKSTPIYVDQLSMYVGEFEF